MSLCRFCGESNPLNFYPRMTGTCKACHLRRTEETRRRSRLTPEGRARIMLDTAKTSAKRRGHVVSISRDWITARLREGVCAATGIPFVFENAPGYRTHPYAPSLDRINPGFGYTPENTRVVVWAFNAMRNEFGDEVLDEVFRSWKETSCEPC